MCIAQGQEQTTPWGQMLMSKESPYHFAYLLQSLKQSLWSKIGQGKPRVTIWTNFDGPEASMLHTKPQGYWPFDSGEEDFWSFFFYHIRAWRPSWSRDPEPVNELSFPYPTEASYKIWLW